MSVNLELKQLYKSYEEVYSQKKLEMVEGIHDEMLTLAGMEPKNHRVLLHWNFLIRQVSMKTPNTEKYSSMLQGITKKLGKRFVEPVDHPTLAALKKPKYFHTSLIAQLSIHECQVAKVYAALHGKDLIEETKELVEVNKPAYGFFKIPYATLLLKVYGYDEFKAKFYDPYLEHLTSLEASEITTCKRVLIDLLMEVHQEQLDLPKIEQLRDDYNALVPLFNEWQIDYSEEMIPIEAHLAARLATEPMSEGFADWVIVESGDSSE